MKTVIHEADSRGYFNHGWLKTHHSFSFANYNNPERVHFGALRVLNDDSVDAGKGFGTHSHDNMEIVSITLSGILEHRDSMGHLSELNAGEVQVMSAGTGIRHSEYSGSTDVPTEFLQIWVIPEEGDVTPRYQNGSISELIVKNRISEIVYPYSSKEAVDNGKLWIHQQAWFSIAKLDQEVKVNYELHSDQSYGVYLFVIDGCVTVGGKILEKRDAMEITESQQFEIEAINSSNVLLIEVPAYSGR